MLLKLASLLIFISMSASASLGPIDLMADRSAVHVDGSEGLILSIPKGMALNLGMSEGYSPKLEKRVKQLHADPVKAEIYQLYLDQQGAFCNVTTFGGSCYPSTFGESFGRYIKIIDQSLD
jgi:ABC-type tungstate transport system substrate-binding protein